MKGSLNQESMVVAVVTKAVYILLCHKDWDHQMLVVPYSPKQGRWEQPTHHVGTFTLMSQVNKKPLVNSLALMNDKLKCLILKLNIMCI